MHTDVIIIGGGHAGLTAAIHLKKNGLKVIVFEKHPYPRHKVCGEYISNEVLPYLDWLGIDIKHLNPSHINKFQMHTLSGMSASAELPLGGFGIRWFMLDDHLCKHAVAKGVDLRIERVEATRFENDMFEVQTPEGKYFSKSCLGAFGKRSNIESSASPTTMVWILWSLKESAYKCRHRTDRKRRFDPLSFKVCLDTARQTADVCYGTSTFYAFYEANDNFIQSWGSTSRYTASRLTPFIFPSTSHHQPDYHKDADGVPYFVNNTSPLTRLLSVSNHGRFCSYISTLIPNAD